MRSAEQTSSVGHHVIGEVAEVSKSFGENVVLSALSLELRAGEVVALAGENGAGKSTLLKILAGLVVPDSGSVTIEGDQLHAGDVRAAHQAGIAIVLQELSPVLDMCVYQNIFLGRELKNRAGFLDHKRMIEESRAILGEFELDIDPRAKMRGLSTGVTQLIEIIKNISSGCRILLLDEPTSAITQREIDVLYGVIEDLRRRGVGMLYTTHKMSEMRDLADRVVVLRDGRLVLDRPIGELSDDDIVTSMIGRELANVTTDRIPPGERVILELSGISSAPDAAPFDLRLRSGEIVALCGLMGAGRTELLETVYGMRRRSGGAVVVDGEELRRTSESASIAAGLALVTEDRKESGIIPGQSILRNSMLPWLRRFSTFGVLSTKTARAEVGEVMQSVKLKATSLQQDILNLSGGNQQKIVLGRWLLGNPKVLLLDEPSRGVDVGARAEIYGIIRRMAAEEGLAVLMATSEIPEALALAHRILVMRDGDVVGELPVDEHSDPDQLQEHIFALAAGIEPVGPSFESES